jgi:hypothetical protein
MRIRNDYVATFLYEFEQKSNKGHKWLAYDTSSHFTKERKIFFFRTKNKAEKFIENKKATGSAYQNGLIEPIIFLLEDWLSLTLNKLIHTTSIHINTPEVLIDYEKQQLQTNNYLLLKTKFMNEQNLDYLKGNIRLTGFGENFNEQLEKHLKEGKDDFQLFYKNEFNKKPFEAILNLRKSDTTDMYFFNGYHASLEKSNGEKVDQTFYLNKGKGVTAKEAFNLLDGRSVHKQLTPKEGEPYHAWLKLDFENKDKNNNFEVKQFHENYGYDLKAAVSKYAVAELNNPEKEKPLMESLQRGNVQSVTIDKNGSPEKMFIEANPQFKSVTLYDGHMKRVPKESIEQYHSKGQVGGQEVKVEKEEVKKKDNKQDLTKGTKQKNSLLPKKQNGNGLLEKKRTSSKKGMAIG